MKKEIEKTDGELAAEVTAQAEKELTPTATENEASEETKAEASKKGLPAELMGIM